MALRQNGGGGAVFIATIEAILRVYFHSKKSGDCADRGHFHGCRFGDLDPKTKNNDRIFERLLQHQKPEGKGMGVGRSVARSSRPSGGLLMGLTPASPCSVFSLPCGAGIQQREGPDPMRTSPGEVFENRLSSFSTTMKSLTRRGLPRSARIGGFACELFGRVRNSFGEVPGPEPSRFCLVARCPACRAKVVVGFDFHVDLGHGQMCQHARHSHQAGPRRFLYPDVGFRAMSRRSEFLTQPLSRHQGLGLDADPGGALRIKEPYRREDRREKAVGRNRGRRSSNIWTLT